MSEYFVSTNQGEPLATGSNNSTDLTNAVFYHPPDFDLTNPPDYPQNLTVFAHARWRFPLLPDDLAKGTQVLSWESVEDFRRWESRLGMEGEMSWPEDPGATAPFGWSREEAKRIGGVSDRGYRTGHMLFRPGLPPKVGWSSYQKLFGPQAPAKLSETQEQTGNLFTLLRSLDLAILTHDSMPEAQRRQVQRIVVYGLPTNVTVEPRSKQSLDFWKVIQGKMEYHRWEIEVRECLPNSNIAAFISGMYAAPCIRSPIRNRYSRYPYAGLSIGQAGEGAKSQLLERFQMAFDQESMEGMAEVFSAMVAFVNQKKQAYSSTVDSVDSNAETPSLELLDTEDEGEEPSANPVRGVLMSPLRAEHR